MLTLLMFEEVKLQQHLQYILLPYPDEGHKPKRVDLTVQLLCILQVSLEFYLFRVFPFSMHQVVPGIPTLPLPC